MKMKLAVCTEDENYASRFINYFNIHYADRVELVQFTDYEMMRAYLAKGKLDFCLIGNEFSQEMRETEFASVFPILLTDDRDEELEDVAVLYKYQKAEIIYKELLNRYADKKSGVRSLRKRNPNDAHTYVFCSPQGGGGATSVALAFATRLAKERSVLYISLQQYENFSLYLKGEGSGNFGDVIFALKSKRGSLSLKLESLTRTGRGNIHFYESCENPIDMMELEAQELERLLGEVVCAGEYQDVILDIDNKMGELERTAMSKADYIILVTGGSESDVKKFESFYKTMEGIENRENVDLLSKSRLFYNKFSNKSGVGIDEEIMQSVGGCPRIDGVQMEGVISRMSMLDGVSSLKDLEIE